jgi:23S rRNA (adenine2503-C2)-methyltransferase
MIELLGLTKEELRTQAEAWGLSAYRGSQLYHAIYRERLWLFDQMTTLPSELRAQLATLATITPPRIVSRYPSKDGAVRYVLQLGGEKPVTVEAVWMPEDDRQTLCISSQAGCAVDCRFCATASLGLLRNLTAGEVAGQVLAVLEEHKAELRPRTNVVLMGQGEPLHNYDATLKAVRLLADPKGMDIPLRRLTLSTSGVIPGIERLAQEEVRPKLAVSLNASTDEQRSEIIPLNRKWPIAELLTSLQKLSLRRWEYIMFEYVVLGGFNDTVEDARRVVKLLSHLKCKVNLIPWNAVPSLPYRAPTDEAVLAFQRVLIDHGFKVFIRKSRGQDVFAACGQLSLLEISK